MIENIRSCLCTEEKKENLKIQKIDGIMISVRREYVF